MNRFGVCQWSLEHPGPAALIQAAELGFGAIHLDAGALEGDLLLDDPALVAAYGRAAQETGVQIAAVAPGYLNEYGLTSPAGSENALRCARIVEIAIAAASELGAPLVFLPSFRNGEIRDEPGLQRTAEAMQAACDLAAAHGLIVATENTLGAEDNLRLLRAVDRPNARVLLDTQNPALWGHPVAGLAAALAPHLADQVHVKDGRAGEMGNAVLGAGDSDFAATAAALRAQGFAGLLISENDYLGERLAHAAQDLAALAEFFPPL